MSSEGDELEISLKSENKKGKTLKTPALEI